MKSIEILKSVKPIEILPDIEMISLKAVSEYFETTESTIYALYQKEKKSIEEAGSKNLKDIDFEKSGYKRINPKRTGCKEFENNGVSIIVSGRGSRCFTAEAVLKMATYLTRNPIAIKVINAAEGSLSNENIDTETIDKADTYKDTVTEKDKRIEVFSNPELGSVRIITIQGEPWFVGKDVAELLGYERTADTIRTHIDSEDKGVVKMKTPGGKQNVTIINESGLYSLMLSSKLESAKKFKHWITSEVLPSIRKHGAYMTPETLKKALTNTDFLLGLVTRLKEEETKNGELSQNLKNEQIKNENLMLENNALSGRINTWGYKSILNALIRLYANRHCRNDFAMAWNIFYKNLNYKMHINLRTRAELHCGSKKKLLDFLKKDEIKLAVKVAAAMCVQEGIDISGIMKKAGAEAI